MLLSLIHRKMELGSWIQNSCRAHCPSLSTVGMKKNFFSMKKHQDAVRYSFSHLLWLEFISATKKDNIVSFKTKKCTFNNTIKWLAPVNIYSKSWCASLLTLIIKVTFVHLVILVPRLWTSPHDVSQRGSWGRDYCWWISFSELRK